MKKLKYWHSCIMEREKTEKVWSERGRNILSVVIHADGNFN